MTSSRRERSASSLSSSFLARRLGAFASAFFLYGVALLYGYAGTVDLRGNEGVIIGMPPAA